MLATDGCPMGGCVLRLPLAQNGCRQATIVALPQHPVKI